MRIDRIELGNFRNFDRASFEFPTNFTVIIGENGKGKSSILQSLRIAAATFFLGIDEAERYHIQKTDVRRIDLGNRFVPQKNCYFEAQGIVNATKTIWKRTLATERGRTDAKDASSLVKIAEILNNCVNEKLESAVNLPVIAYFSTARLWAESKQTIKLKKKGSKIKDGYARCIDERSDKISTMEWIKSNYWKKIKDKPESVLFDAVLEAIDICIPNWTPIEWDEDSDDLAGFYSDSEGKKHYVPLFFLSDGLRTMAGMVAEIAYRCAVLNEHLGKNAVKESQGIVLIDEIDMHLHPKWQQNVVSDLKKAFPNIQFIVTTHSPFIVQSIKSEELINLDAPINEEPINLGIEDVATLVMKVNPKSSHYTQLYETASEYFKTLDATSKATKKNQVSLKKKLDILAQTHQNDPAFAAFLEMNRLAKLGKD